MTTSMKIIEQTKIDKYRVTAILILKKQNIIMISDKKNYANRYIDS